MSGPTAGPDLDLLQTILRCCAAAAPEPWYPKAYAETAGVPRDRLDLPLEQLRLAGLIRLTDWVQGRGQGYALTPLGARALERPRLLGQLHDGKWKQTSLPEQPPPLHPPGTRLYQKRTQLQEELQNAGPPIVTRLLLFANIIVFLWGLHLASQRGLPQAYYIKGGDTFAPNAAAGHNPGDRILYYQLLHDLGGLDPGDILDGRWWRLLTCCFVHGGLLHLGMNMYALLVLGRIVEQMWGHWRFLLIYLISGLGGSCAAMIFRPSVGLVGASGALCGILGSVASFIFLNRQVLARTFIVAWRTNLLINLLILVAMGYYLRDFVSNEGHFGGAAVGLVVAAALNFQRFSSGWRRWLALAAALAVPVACLGALAYARGHSPAWKEQDDHRRQQEEEREARARWQEEQRAARARREQLQKDDNNWVRLKEMNKGAESKSRGAEDIAWKLLLKIPQVRQEDQVKQALAALAEAQTMLDKAAEGIAAAEPYKAPEIERKRELRVQYLKARSRLCATIEAYLKEERYPTKEDFEALRKQGLQVNDLREHSE
jgi:membrane associated rhomboid family serine protease